MQRFVFLTVFSALFAVVVSVWMTQHRTGAVLDAIRRRAGAVDEPAEIALPAEPEEVPA